MNHYTIKKINGFELPSEKKLKLKEVRDLLNTADIVNYIENGDGSEDILIKIDSNILTLVHYSTNYCGNIN